MTATPTNLLRHVRQLVASHASDSLTDHQLLELFAAGRDEAMFAMLVRRHGPMVLGVCRRVLGHEQDAEDAFQAAFLILARKAASIRQSDVGGFLYRVAYRLAVRGRAAAARRGQRDQMANAASRTTLDPVTDVSWREVRAVLEEELQYLPDALRCAVVLCYLEGKTRPEAARLLNWSKGTLHRRLERGRELLRRRLLARGLAPMAALTGSLFAEGGTSAMVPATLAAATVRGALNAESLAPAVAGLVDAGCAMLSAGKTKAATAILFFVSLLGGAGVWLGAQPPAAVAPSAEIPAAKVSEKPQVAPPQRTAAKSLEIQGRVFGVDGQPKAGAKLLLLDKDSKIKPLGASAADGRFTVTVPKETSNRWQHWLIAQADGAGLDFLALYSLKSEKPVELRLVKDNAIRGRVVNTEGKPIRGVRVAAEEIEVYGGNSLDTFRVAWMKLWAGGAGTGLDKHIWSGAGALFATITDADGRFTLHGMGAERTIRFRLGGAGIADTSVWVANRAGLDPKPYNRPIFDHIDKGHLNYRWSILSGPDVSVVAEAEKVIRGVVTDADSGKGCPGIVVRLTQDSDELVHFPPKAKTDAEGRYEMHGVRKAKKYLVAIDADRETAYMPSQVWVEDTTAYRPVRADIKIKKGVIVTGNVIDGTTGQALPGYVMAAVLFDNSFAKDYPPFSHLGMMQFESADRTDTDRAFRVVTIPGPMLLMGQTEGMSPIAYKGTGADPKYPKYFFNDGGGYRGYSYGAPLQGHWNKVLEIKPGVAVVKQDIVLERANVLATVNIQDAEGRPVSDVFASANGPDNWIMYGRLQGSSGTVYGPATGKPQLLVFYEPKKKLAGTRTLMGDEKQPVVVKLGPAGALKGRLLDADGKPLAGIVVDLRYRDRAGDDVHKEIHQAKQIVSDATGAFAFDEVIPGLKLELSFRGGKRKLERESKPVEATVEVKPSERRDLGALKLKLTPPEKAEE